MTRHARAVLVAALIALSATGCGSVSDNATTGGNSGGNGSSGSGGNASGGLDGGPPPSGAVGGDNQCLARFNPYPTGIATGASVKGTLETYCKTPPHRHDLTMYLQRDINDRWTTQAEKDITVIPGKDPRYNLVTAPCVPGVWRLVVSIDGTSGNGKQWTVEQTGETREVKPSECS